MKGIVKGALVTKQLSRTALTTLAIGLLLLAPAFGQEKPEHYSAVWQVVGGSAGGTTVPIDIRVNKYNTEEDIQELAELLKDSGPDALLRVLEKKDVGQLSSTGRVGVEIALARKVKSGDKTVVYIVAVRNMSFVELRYSGRSTDYPYTILQLELPENGPGKGTAIGAAKIRFNRKANIYEIESLEHGTAYNKLANVQLVESR